MQTFFYCLWYNMYKIICNGHTDKQAVLLPPDGLSNTLYILHIQIRISSMVVSLLYTVVE